MLKIRQASDAAIFGETREYDHDNRKIVAYSRIYGDEKLFVFCNFSSKSAAYKLPEWTKNHEVLISNYRDLLVSNNVASLRPYEAAVIRIK